MDCQETSVILFKKKISYRFRNIQPNVIAHSSFQKEPSPPNQTNHPVSAINLHQLQCPGDQAAPPPQNPSQIQGRLRPRPPGVVGALEPWNIALNPRSRGVLPSCSGEKKRKKKHTKRSIENPVVAGLLTDPTVSEWRRGGYGQEGDWSMEKRGLGGGEGEISRGGQVGRHTGRMKG